METGQEPTPEETAVFDQTLMLYSEHEMPNSTFAARVIASTNTDIYGAFTGAAASLKGHLHGGANEAVMYMLLEGETKSGFCIPEAALAACSDIETGGRQLIVIRKDAEFKVQKSAL